MTSTELVGPVRRFRLGDPEYRGRGEWDTSNVRWIAVPRDTLAAEARACVHHWAGCPCLMARVAEDQTERMGEGKHTRQVFNRVLSGHPTWTEDGEPSCMCTGCQIARELYTRAPYEQRIDFEALEVQANTTRLRSWQADVLAGSPSPSRQILDAEIVPF